MRVITVESKIKAGDIIQTKEDQMYLIVHLGGVLSKGKLGLVDLKNNALCMDCNEPMELEISSKNNVKVMCGYFEHITKVYKANNVELVVSE